jgi:aspartate 1-decarboxylase
MFQRKFLIGKIHRATVTGADVNYVGSITIDPILLEASGLLPLEEVEVWDVTNGERLSTYCLPGARGSGQVTLNGAAARKVQAGDKVIIATYARFDPETSGPFEAKVVVPDDQNRIARAFSYRTDPATRSFEIVESR